MGCLGKGDSIRGNADGRCEYHLLPTQYFSWLGNGNGPPTAILAFHKRNPSGRCMGLSLWSSSRVSLVLDSLELCVDLSLGNRASMPLTPARLHFPSHYPRIPNKTMFQIYRRATGPRLDCRHSARSR